MTLATFLGIFLIWGVVELLESRFVLAGEYSTRSVSFPGHLGSSHKATKFSAARAIAPLHME